VNVSKKVCFEKKQKQKPPPERKNLLTYASGILLKFDSAMIADQLCYA
jgi:hypothetical protein